MLTVKQRQSNLKFLNYYGGATDGLEGQGTKNAYKSFQRDNGLVADGVYGVNTDNKLISVIKDIQSKLGTNPDGVVGSNTVEKCKQYQRDNGLVADGVCGASTRSKLNSNASSWDSVKHFKKEEMNCKCGCGLNNTDLHLMHILEQIREHFGGKPVVITSGCRCKKHNASLKGSASNSKHLYGKAADIYIKGVSTSNLLNYTKSLVKNGTLRYTYTNSRNMNGVVHVDIN
jgi:hypothetical protein